MDKKTNIELKERLGNNTFCRFYEEKASIDITIIFLDLQYKIRPKKYDYYVCELYFDDLNNNDEIDFSNNNSSNKYLIQSDKASLNIKLKKKLYSPCCFYQYHSIKFVFMNDKKEERYISYTIPIYFNQQNYIFSLFYGIGKMSFEIIIRRDTFFENDWIREPILDFIIENNCIPLKSHEKFEENASQKRFLFINIHSYRCFPNLNLSKYSIFKYALSTREPSNFAIYIDEDFDHIGFYLLNSDSLIEKIFNFSDLQCLYNKCFNFKKSIDLIKKSFENGEYDFRTIFYGKILDSFDELNVLEDEINNFDLFFRQNIVELKDKGKDLILFVSYIIIILKFQQKEELKEYFDYIIILFETFQLNFKNKNYKKLDELKLIYSLAEILIDYLKDDYIKEIKKIDLKDIVKKNLIRIIDFNDNNSIYSFVENNNYDIINNLNQSSYLFYILNQFNSSIGKNNIRSSYKSSAKSECSMISMITLDNLKSEFKTIKQSVGLKLGFKTEFNAVTNTITKISSYNEIKLFGELLEIDHIAIDPNYLIRLKLSTCIKHERFCHTLVSINIFTGNLKGSPEEYLDFQNKKKVKLVTKGHQESGNAFEYLITKDSDFLDFLRSPPENLNFKEFFDYKLWIDTTMDELYELYLKLYKKIKNNEKKILSPGHNLTSQNNENEYSDSEEIFNQSKMKICKNDYCDIFKEQNSSKK